MIDSRLITQSSDRTVAHRHDGIGKQIHAGVAQWQSSSFVMSGLEVRFLSPAPESGILRTVRVLRIFSIYVIPESNWFFCRKAGWRRTITQVFPFENCPKHLF